MKDKVIIWGASGHARVVADILRLRGECEIVGFLDDVDPGAPGKPFCGSRVLGGAERLEELARAGVCRLTFGFGACAAKQRRARVAERLGFTFFSALHPRAVVAEDARIGGGAVIAAGAVVGVGVRLGENVIVNTSASVDHDCTIGEAVHICPGVRLGGGVWIDDGSWIGIGSIVKDGVAIGAGSIVGAGSLVIRDVPPGVVAFGSPAVARRNVTENDVEIGS